VRETTAVLLAPLRIEVLAVARAGGVRVERTGMGANRAEAARARLQRELPAGTPVCLIGFAGGLSATDRPGDVVVATEVKALDGTVPPYDLDGQLAARLVSALSRGGSRARRGRVVSVRKLAPAATTAKAEGAAGALACDMESAWLAPLADDHPFAVVRVLVDRPGRGLVSPFVIPAGIAAWRQLAAIAPVVASEIDATTSAVMTR
jgi:4-hydroxy-3-methylbut-2-enyl diphosphate reductase